MDGKGSGSGGAGLSSGSGHGPGGAFGQGGANGAGGRGGGGGGVGGGGGAAAPNSGGGGGGGFGGGGGAGHTLGGGGGFGGGGGGITAAGTPGVGGYGGGSGGIGIGGGGAGMGGAIFNMFGKLTINSSTLSGNTATGGFGTGSGQGLGGAIANLNGTVTVESSTLSFNAAAEGGGAVFSLGYDGSGSHSAAVTLSRSILSDTSGSAVDLLVDRPAEVAPGLGNVAVASIARDGNVLVETTNVQGTVLTTGTPLNSDPQLGSLGSNGGLTPTHLPAAASPVIDAGGSGCPVADQRGITRPAGAACDIGAVEREPASPGGPGPDPDPDPVTPRDQVPPDTVKGAGPKRRSTSRRATFSFSSEPGALFVCKLDGKPFEICAAPLTKRVKLGKHTFLAAAVDAAGNFDVTPAIWNFRVVPKPRRGRR